MKAIAFNRTPDTPMIIPPEIDIIVDSAITLPGRPLFLPDFDTNWQACFFLAARISRLGKDISVKFASRYFDAVTVAMRLIPVTVDADLASSARHTGLTGLFDNALALGEWLPVPTDDTPATLTIGTDNIIVDTPLTLIHEAINTISSYATLKMGDIVMPCRSNVGLAVNSDDNIRASLNGASCLDIRIK